MKLVKKSLISLCLAALFAASLDGCPSPSGGGNGVSSVNGAEAHRLVSGGATLVDVRTPEEFASGHAEGARNIPVDDLDARRSELSRDKVIVVYCASGARSARAASMLAHAGFRVRDLGTLDAWNR